MLKSLLSKMKLKKKWHIDELPESRKFILDFMGKDLKYGRNYYKIEVDYHDGLNKQYNANKGFSIELANVNMLQQLLLWFNGFDKTRLAIMLFIAAVVFIGIIGLLWRKK